MKWTKIDCVFFYSKHRQIVYLCVFSSGPRCIIRASLFGSCNLNQIFDVHYWLVIIKGRNWNILDGSLCIKRTRGAVRFNYFWLFRWTAISIHLRWLAARLLWLSFLHFQATFVNQCVWFQCSHVRIYTELLSWRQLNDSNRITINGLFQLIHHLW